VSEIRPVEKGVRAAVEGPPRAAPAATAEPAGDEAVRVSTLELFFDLVFVFTITQLTSVLFEDPSGRGLARVVLMLGVIWWMYGGYAWLTNAVAPDSTPRRLTLLVGMIAFFVLALAIPRAFAGSGTSFGLAYLAVVAIHAALFTRTSSEHAVRAILRLAPFNLVTALLVLAGGIAGGSAEYALWASAFVLEWASPHIAGQAGFEVAAAHFVERHGLVVLVAIGESVVAVGIGARTLQLDFALAAIGVLGLLLSACLWWAYFGGDEEAAVQALERTPAARRPQLALGAFGYWHLPILLGIVAAAATLRHATAHPFSALAFARALALGGGVATFLAGDVLYRRTLALGALRWRTLAAILALATIAIGALTAAAAQLAGLVLALAGCLVAERRLLRTAARSP
jgi:low temperature requirement protein LtrA